MDKTVNKRILWIDVYKGVAITLMVLGHTSGVIVPYIYTFHMAAFFFISGYTERLEEKKLGEIIIDKFTSLLIPYFGINIGFLLLRLLMQLCNVQELFYDEIINLNNVSQYIRLLIDINWTPDLGGATWFLVALFGAFVISKIIIILTKNKIGKITLSISFFSLILAYLGFKYNIRYNYFIDLSLSSNFYIILGRYVNIKGLTEKFELKSSNRIYIVIILYMIICGRILNLNVDYPSRDFNNPILDIISSIIGIIIIYNISLKIEKSTYSKIIKYIGENSLGILILHFLLFRITFLIEVILGIENIQILKSLVPPQNKYDGILYTLLVLIMFYYINNKFYKYNIYRYLILGKYKFYIQQNKIVQKFIAIVIIILLLFNLPYKSINKIIDIYVLKNNDIYIENRFEDKFVGKKVDIFIKNSDDNYITFNLYVTDNTLRNSMKIYIDNNIIEEVPLSTGENKLKFEIPENNNIKIQLEFKQTFIPAQISNTDDNRELSVILNSVILE